MLFGEPRLGRRFAIHALPHGAGGAIFTVLTSFRKSGAVNRTELALRATALFESRAITA